MTVHPLRRLPLRIRLILGFAAAMLVVLIAAGAFVYWRVQYALDSRLADDLGSEVTDLQRAAILTPDATSALASLGAQGRDAQLLDRSGRVLATGSGFQGRPALLTPAEVGAATSRPVSTARGYLFSRRGRHLRIQALPVRGSGPAAVAVAAVRLDQRDEALRELLGQLTLANLGALAIASVVGYRLARAALLPVERYRSRAEQIAAGATGVRLDVPDSVDDEVSRLGHTLNTMLAAQEQAASQQQQFIDDASHELRTPLTVLAAEIDLALRRPRSAEEYETVLLRLADDTDRLVELADDLLLLGTQTTSVPQRQQLSAADLLDGAAARARASLTSGPAREVWVSAATGLTVDADPVLIRRALGNLADNAVRHGAGTITLTAAPFSDTRLGEVVLTVHDEGPGMPVEFLPHAAERFRQAELSRAGEGNGLGLSLVDAIAVAHGGQLRLCSTGHHHRQPTPNSQLDDQPCTHPVTGATASLLLPAPADAPRPEGDRA